MAFVFLAGTVTRGSRRWIDLGFFRFQPSEFGKLLLVLFLAAFLADRYKRIQAGDPRVTLAAIGLALVPIVLVFIQPDFGTALVYGVALIAVLFVAGTRWIQLAVLGAVLLVAALSLLWFLPAAGIARAQALPGRPPDRLHESRPRTRAARRTTSTSRSPRSAPAACAAAGSRARRRRTSTTCPSTRPTSSSPRSRSSAASSAPLVALLLYLLVVWRGLRIITLARDAFSAIAAGGIVFVLLFQVFVNVGMTMGIAPITGIPLPFVSVGGSSMIANLAAIGVLLAIHARGRGVRR